ncbi:MAG: sensor histidine kinase [Flavobacterium sp. BFFFF1]|nr:MAG: sensor histidine kinase [Flavobacterium sp. BFFFF1]
MRNDSVCRRYYVRIANRYFNMNAMADYRYVNQVIIRKSKLANDTLGLANAYTYMADYYARKNIQDSVYEYNFKAEKLFRAVRDNARLATTLLNRAVLQHNKSDFLSCERTVFDLLRTLRHIDNVGMKYEANNLLGIVYGELEEYSLAKKYYDKAIAIAARDDMPKEREYKASTLNNIGILYTKQNKYTKAIQSYEFALRDKDLFKKDPIIFAALTDNLAYSKFRLKSYSQLPQLFTTALKIRDSLNFIPGVVLSKIHLSQFFALKKDTVTAIKYASEANILAKDSSDTRDVLLSLKQLANVMPKKALQFSTEYYKLDDSLQIAERKEQNKFARIEFETDELVQEKTQLVQQRKTLIYSALGIILVGVFIFIIRVQRAKNRELRLIREQQKANEEIYNLMITQQQQRDEGRQLEKKRIARELHDGVMGQLSAIRMNLFVLDKKQDEQTIRQCLPHVEKIQDVEKEIRNIAYDLDAPLQSNTDFTEVIHTIFAGLEQHSGISFVLEADDSINWNAVLVDTKVQLYRILQEALQNIVKYANAGKVMVSIGRRESMLLIIVQDDGIGFDPDNARKGLGLRNMRQRAQEIGGTMTVTTALGAGTKLEISIPFSAS